MYNFYFVVKLIDIKMIFLFLNLLLMLDIGRGGLVIDFNFIFYKKYLYVKFFFIFILCMS